MGISFKEKYFLWFLSVFNVDFVLLSVFNNLVIFILKIFLYNYCYIYRDFLFEVFFIFFLSEKLF